MDSEQRDGIALLVIGGLLYVLLRGIFLAFVWLENGELIAAIFPMAALSALIHHLSIEWLWARKIEKQRRVKSKAEGPEVSF